MLDFKEKRRLKKVLYSKPTIILLGLILIFLVNTVWGIYNKAKVAHDNKELVLQNFNDLKEREEYLSLKIEKLKTERGIEEEVREKFGVVREGEEVVIVVDSDIENEKYKKQNIFNPQGLWQKFLSIFKWN